MPDPTVAAIVNAALALRASHPHAPAVGVLDLAIKGRGVWLEDFLEHVLPPSPFALLVAEAMGDCMMAAEWKAFTGPDANARVRDAMTREYATSVLPKFVKRYGFSHPQAEGATITCGPGRLWPLV
jgi:hypothetical protein